MKKSARYAAIETLNRLARTRKPLEPLFNAVIAENSITTRDRQLSGKIVRGVLRHRQSIDQVLSALCHRPIGTMKPFIYHALTTGVYQLLFLDRVPVSAAVNETVAAVRSAGYPARLAGFVNGVLRECDRRRDEFLITNGSAAEGAAILTNHPDWLIKRWEKAYGYEEMVRICSHNNKEPVLALRVTRPGGRSAFMCELEKKGVVADPGPYAPDAVLLPGYHESITDIPGYHEGLFQVQDQAAQLATLLLGPFAAGSSYLDGCAGLGGKTSYLAVLAATAGGSVTAVEPNKKRFELLLKNLDRLAQTGIDTHNETLEVYAQTSSCRFQGIIIDAPCSGTGVIGRQPDIRWNRKEHDLAAYQKCQLNLLKTAAELLAPGGVLVYSTCSIEPEENEAVVRQLLHTAQTNLKITDCSDFLPTPARIFVRDRFFAPLPDDGIDGFFAARFVKF